MSLFDGLAAIFAETFGEPVVYTPIATNVPATIEAIWIEQGVTVVGGPADTDSALSQLHVRAADVSEPKEGDVAQRVSDGRIMKVSTPITPDGQGMIVCNLAAV